MLLLVSFDFNLSNIVYRFWCLYISTEFLHSYIFAGICVIFLVNVLIVEEANHVGRGILFTYLCSLIGKTSFHKNVA